MNIKTIAKTGLKIAKANSPILLTSGGIATIITTEVMMYKAGGKSALEIQGAERNKKRALTRKEKTSIHLRNLWPSFITNAIGFGSIIGSDYIQGKRQVVLASACEAAREELREYKTATEEFLGEKKADQLEQKIVEEQYPVPEDATADYIDDLEDNKGDKVLWLDCYRVGRGKPTRDDLFMARIVDVDKTINWVNASINAGDGVALNDFYRYIGRKGIRSDKRGWSYNITGTSMLERTGVVESITLKNAEGIDVVYQVHLLKFNHAPEVDYDLDTGSTWFHS